MSKFNSDSSGDVRVLMPRFKFLYGSVIIAISLIFLRLWYLQIISGNELREFSEQNLLKETKIPAPRGIVYDRNGQILVENLPGFEATISPQYAKQLDKTAEAVAPVLGMSAQDIVNKVKMSRRKNGMFRPVKIKDNLSRAEVFELELLKIDNPGLDIRENILRTYVLGANGAQMFGYVGEISKEQIPKLNNKYNNQFNFKQGDMIGKSGLEETLDPNLRGKDGLSFVQVDAKGREAAAEEIDYLGSLTKTQRAYPGANVVLTIDKDIQEAAYAAFHTQDRTGALVAMKANGEILAWVSAPSFDPTEFSAGFTSETWKKLTNHPDKPLRNKVIQDHNFPGSTFKPIMAVAALQEKIITKDTLVTAPSSYKFGNRVYHDHSKTGHGVVRVREAIEKSSNVFFYKMGIELKVDRIAKYAKGLGLGEKTGVDIPNEVPGIIPTSEWKLKRFGEPWQPGENLSIAIGQGYVVVTPLQMAVAYNTIATEGKVVKPFVVKKIVSPDGSVLVENQPTLRRDLSLEGAEPYVSHETFTAVKEGMWAVSNGAAGTARAHKIPGVELAGKTGTAQVRSFSADKIYNKCENQPRKDRHHGWFVAYAPAEAPEIVVAVLAEHSCHGSSGGGPVARDVIKRYFEKYHPDRLKNIAIKGPMAKLPAAPAPVVEEEEVEEGL